MFLLEEEFVVVGDGKKKTHPSQGAFNKKRKKKKSKFNHQIKKQ